MKTVIEMAREAGLFTHKEVQPELERFAELVRKDYSFTHAQMWLKRFDDAILAERQRIVNLLMIQHEAAKGVHNYWHVAANLIQADVASNT
jgi:hypothetical protein